jgi:hypothetical protein
MSEGSQVADLLNRMIPTGFSTPEDNAWVCTRIDGISDSLRERDGGIDFCEAAGIVADGLSRGAQVTNREEVQNFLDSAAAEILILNADKLDGIASLVCRLQQKLELVGLELAVARSDLQDRKDVALMARARALLGPLDPDAEVHIDGVTGLDGTTD